MTRGRTGDGMKWVIISLFIIVLILLAGLGAVVLDHFGVIELPISCAGLGKTKAPTIEQDSEDPGRYFVTVYADPGTKLVFETSRGNRNEAEVSRKGYVVFSVPDTGLIPPEPIDGGTCLVTPKIYKIGDDGSETLITGFTPVEVNVPAIKISFDNGDHIAAKNGSAEISGRVEPAGSAIIIAGESVEVGQDGSFSHAVAFKEAGEQTVAFEARCPGYRIFRKSFTVTVDAAAVAFIQFPWEYGDETFTQRVKNNADTPLEVWGRVPAGSRVTVSSASESVGLTDPTVDGDGKFLFIVTMPTAGDYELRITCAAPSGEVVERVLHVQRAPEWRSYVESSWAMSYEALSYSSKRAYKISGKVTEVIEDGDSTIVRLDIGGGQTVILHYHHHYPNAGTLELGSVHTGIYGHPTGKNADGDPEVYVWFIID
ncbi:MAG: hypothetical protein J5854_02800 [Clostridia bacterium]|nr:hypothetical protein [Clostridia bacterium]